MNVTEVIFKEHLGYINTFGNTERNMSDLFFRQHTLIDLLNGILITHEWFFFTFAESKGYSLDAVCGLLIAGISVLWWSICSRAPMLKYFWYVGSVVVALSSSAQAQ